MASSNIEDHIGSDGVLRSLLSKTINNVPYPLYPRTSAEIVNYNDSNVEQELNRLGVIINNIIAIVNQTTTDLATVSNSKYNKAYIDEALNGIRDSISNLNITTININNTLNNMSYYTQNQIDQLFITYSSQAQSSISQLDIQISQIYSYIRENYISNTQFTSYYSDITREMESIRGDVIGQVTRSLNEYELRVSDIVRNSLQNYYNKEQINSIDSRLTSSINSTNIDLANLRRETTEMNAADVSELKEHTNNIRIDIESSQQNKLTALRNNLDAKTDEQTAQLEGSIDVINGTVASINTNVAQQFSSFNALLGEVLQQNFAALSAQIAAIQSGGGSGDEPGEQPSTPITPVVPVVQYESADDIYY